MIEYRKLTWWYWLASAVLASVAFSGPLRALYLVLLCGTWANVLVGYSPLARTLSLAPWNRREPLTPNLVWRTLTTPPRRGEFRPAPPASVTDGWTTTTGEVGV